MSIHECSLFHVLSLKTSNCKLENLYQPHEEAAEYECSRTWCVYLRCHLLLLISHFDGVTNQLLWLLRYDRGTLQVVYWSSNSRSSVYYHCRQKQAASHRRTILGHKPLACVQRVCWNDFRGLWGLFARYYGLYFQCSQEICSTQWNWPFQDGHVNLSLSYIRWYPKSVLFLSLYQQLNGCLVMPKRLR